MTTISGNALAKARIGKPMPRSEARRLCNGVVARAKAVNASDEWLHWVVEVGLYGSFAVPGDGPVGDVDMAVRLEPRYEHEDYLRRNDGMIDADGARPRTVIDTLAYAEVRRVDDDGGHVLAVDLSEIGVPQRIDGHAARTYPRARTPWWMPDSMVRACIPADVVQERAGVSCSGTPCALAHSA